MVLVLFTNSFPYDAAAEHTFIESELPYLKEVFNYIILVPKVCHGKKLPLDAHTEIEESYARFLNRRTRFLDLIFYALISHHLYRELLDNPEIILSPFKFLKLIKFSSYAEITRRWVKDWLESSPLLIRENALLLYTYWFEEITTGISLTKDFYPKIKLVSRAHGYDIYEEQYFPYYWPCRRQTLARVDKLFTASDDGRNYFRNRFPEFYDVFDTAHLGVKDPGFVSSMSSGKVLRIVSCAHILPLKRIDLLSRGIAVAAKMRPEQKIEWRHFGDGKGRQALQKQADAFPSNASGYFPGFVPNQEIMRHYREEPVDVFVNLSTTEGGAPVSIQEAISCGIPVIATNVGGNPEIVSERNGLLLDPDPTPEEVAEALLWFCDNPEMAKKMRVESRKVWQESYNAEVNFRAFAEQLKRIAES